MSGISTADYLLCYKISKQCGIAFLLEYLLLLPSLQSHFCWQKNSIVLLPRTKAVRWDRCGNQIDCSGDNLARDDIFSLPPKP
jgi:hypothetical protein